MSLSTEKLRELSQIPDGANARRLASTLFGFFLTPLWFAASNPWLNVAGIFWTIHHFNCLSQFVHESDHGTLFCGRSQNRAWGNFCGWFLGYGRSGHLATHLEHHLHLNSGKDPDAQVFGGPRHSARTLAWGLGRDLCGGSALRRFFQYAPDGNTQRRLGRLAPVVLAQLLLVVYYATIVGPAAYFGFYVLPLVTLYPFLIRIRSAAEHGYGHDVVSYPTRTFRPNLVERWLLSPLHQNFHAEHHAHPNVPLCRLPELSQILVENSVPLVLERSYFGVVYREFFAARLSFAKRRPA